MAPDLAAVLAERGGLALDLGQPGDAEPWLRRALGAERQNRIVHYLEPPAAYLPSGRPTRQAFDHRGQSDRSRQLSHL